MAKSPSTGHCGLCGTYTALQSSHVIPRFAYAWIKGRHRGSALERTNGVEVQTTSKQLQFPMLGTCCELRMKRWEDQVKHAVCQADGRFPARDRVEWTLADGDPEYAQGSIKDLVPPDAIAKFGFSVAWRAHVCGELPVDLGEHADRFRLALLEDRLVNDAWCLVEVVQDDEIPIERVLFDPVQRNKDTHQVVAFAMCGLVFYVFFGAVSESLAENLNRSAVDRTGLVGRVKCPPMVETFVSFHRNLER